MNLNLIYRNFKYWNIFKIKSIDNYSELTFFTSTITFTIGLLFMLLTLKLDLHIFLRDIAYILRNQQTLPHLLHQFLLQVNQSLLHICHVATTLLDVIKLFNKWERLFLK